jgi:hypothetical protein
MMKDTHERLLEGGADDDDVQKALMSRGSYSAPDENGVIDEGGQYPILE